MGITFTLNQSILIYNNNKTGCLMDYDYIKNHYRPIAFYMSRQKELDADPKAIQRMQLLDK